MTWVTQSEKLGMHKYTRRSTLRDRHKEPTHVLVGQESSDFEMLSQLRVPQCGCSSKLS